MSEKLFNDLSIFNFLAKDLINDEPVDEPLPTDTEGEYGDLGPPEDTGEELEGDLSLECKLQFAKFP